MKKKGKALTRSTLITALTLSMLPSLAWADAITTITPDGVNKGLGAYDILNSSKLGPNPVDGPRDAEHIFEAYVPGKGNVFQIHANQYGDYDGGNLDRQRIELKGTKSSHSDVRGNFGDTITYNWQFRVMPGFQMSPSGAFNHIFQLKAQDGDDGAPILTFTVADDMLLFRHTATGETMDDVEVLASTPWTGVLNKWVDASITVQNTESGKVQMVLKDVDSGVTLMSYDGVKDNWRTGASVNRPKWGIYRKIFPDIGEGNVQYTGFEITKHTAASGTTHSVDMTANTHIESEHYFSKQGVFRQSLDLTGTRSGDAYMELPQGWTYDTPSNALTYKLNASNVTGNVYLHLYGQASSDASVSVIVGATEGSGAAVPVQLGTRRWGWSTARIPLTNGTQYLTLSTAADGMQLDKMAISASSTPPGAYAVPKLKDLLVDGSTVDGFSPNIRNYTVNLPFGRTNPPVVEAVYFDHTTGADARVPVNQIPMIPGTVTIPLKDPFEPVLATTYTVQFNGLLTEGPLPPKMLYPVVKVEGPGGVNNMVDENIATLWDQKPADTNPGNTVYSSVVFDLGEVQPVNHAFIGFNPTSNKVSFKFDLEASLDKINWTPVLTNQWSSSATSRLQQFSFTEIPARYIRYNGYAGKKADGTLEKYNKVTEIKFAGDSAVDSGGTAFSLNPGQTHQLALTWSTPQGPSADVTAKAIYTSRDESVAIVSSGGLVTAKAIGKTIVDASYDGHMKPIEITVGSAQDTTSPTWASGSKSQVVNTYVTGAFITWTAATDDSGPIAGYRIYSVGDDDTYTLLKEVGNVLYTTLQGLQPGTSYRLALQAVDEAGNASEYGARLQNPFTTLADTKGPAWTGDGIVTVTDVRKWSAKLNWKPAEDNVGVVGYIVQSVTDNTSTDLLPKDVLSYELTSLERSSAYTYTIIAVDEAGNRSANSPSITFSTNQSNAGGNLHPGSGNMPGK